MESVYEEDWNFLEKPKSRDEMSHNDITSDQSIWEYHLSTGVDSLLDGIHCLLFKMGKSLVLTNSLESLNGFLIPCSRCGSHYSLSCSHTYVSVKSIFLLVKRAERLLANHWVASKGVLLLSKSTIFIGSSH
jgi:hypothetical protein